MSRGLKVIIITKLQKISINNYLLHGVVHLRNKLWYDFYGNIFYGGNYGIK